MTTAWDDGIVVVVEKAGGFDDRFDRLEQRLDSLERELLSVRILTEDSTREIRLVAEVQAQHGEAIDRIQQNVGTLTTALTHVQNTVAPISELYAFVRQIASKHEHRLQALERKPQ